ncbi:his operon leader peptide [Buttiauxella izardii]|uniref:his operon leader peptide n=1 Tax=Buttiauxella izardii TaxID=82991 RepID=A0A3A5K4M4_9ENTR|nr:his operon leader peptide [Buttiauxella izardii]
MKKALALNGESGLRYLHIMNKHSYENFMTRVQNTNHHHHHHPD